VKVGLLGAVGLVAALQVLSMTENDWTEKRRESSDFTREVGIRFGIHAISESPLLGYGSWASSPALAAIADQELRAQEARSGMQSPIEYGRGMHTHSQILQGWVEGGLLGATLFLLLAFLLAREILAIIVKRPGDMLTPVLLFVLMFQAWHLFASPLGSSVRLFFAFAMALLVLVSIERTKSARAMRSSPSTGRRHGYRKLTT
jgi:O-antigen ligase